MAYGNVKVDTISYSTVTGDVVLSVSGIFVAQSTVNVFDPVTKNISTTGTISGSTYKVSGNVVVISGSGDVRPYGLYSFPNTSGVSGQFVVSSGDGTSYWATINTSGSTLGRIVALN
jgi:hypothetical protein